MGKNTGIEWADHTVNFWWGCQEVSPGCANCYARTLAKRFHFRIDGSDLLWGQDSQRFIRTTRAAREALRYEDQAKKEGRRFRVFTQSMGDFFEDRPELAAARLEALEVIRRTPNLDWIILTKRPEKIMDHLKRAWEDASPILAGWLYCWMAGDAPPNVWLGTSAEDQERADQRIPALLKAPAAIHFLSCEPLLGPVDLRSLPANLDPAPGGKGHWDWFNALTGTGEGPSDYHGEGQDFPRIDWVIVGGESGAKARPMNPEWARSIRDQCALDQVPFMFKQWGAWCPWDQVSEEFAAKWDAKFNAAGNPAINLPIRTNKAATYKTGRFLDGVEHTEYPRSPA